MTIAQLLYEYKSAYAARTAFVYSQFGEVTEVSVELFCEHVDKVAAYWKQKVNGTGKRIGLVGENSYCYLVHLFGIICSKNIAVPFNQTHENDVIYSYIKRADVSAVICDVEYQDCVKGGDCQEECYIMEQAFHEAVSRDLSGEIEVGESEDVILLLHSSGTSGMSKLVQITNKNLCTFPNHVFVHKNEVDGPGENSLLLLPFYHISGIIPLLEDMMCGNKIYISSAKYMLRDIMQHRINKLILVPSMMKKIVAQCEKSSSFRENCASIREALCLGTSLEADLISRMYQLSILPRVYYGMTETTGTVSGWGEYRNGACGKIEPFSQVKIEDGEILVRGDHVMSGYFRNEHETEKVIIDGWLHTGDLGYIDEEGYLYVKGRKKNIIVLSNGENVSPEELENKLYQCSYITECRVFGEDDMIKAEIYCMEQTDFAHSQVNEFVRTLNRQLPPAQKIKKVDVLTHELKKNSMGKIMR